MKYQFHRRAITLTLALVASSAAFASHVPPGPTVVNYLGTLPIDANATGSINSSGQDGYDFYCIGLTAGRTVTLGASSANGLFPNLILLSSIAAPGATYSTISASNVSEADNSSAASVNLAFTPTISGNYTVVVSTFTGQSGTYQLGGSGFTPINGVCPAAVIPLPAAANVPVPASDPLTLGAMALLLAAIGAFVARKVRTR